MLQRFQKFWRLERSSKIIGKQGGSVYVWGAANGGVNKRGLWPPFLEVGLFQPSLPFFISFFPFSGGSEELLGNPENVGEGPPSSDIFRLAQAPKLPFLKPPFAAPNVVKRIQRKSQGQQLKGKIVSEMFTLFHNLSHIFRIFPSGLSPQKNKGF